MSGVYIYKGDRYRVGYRVAGLLLVSLLMYKITTENA